MEDLEKIIQEIEPILKNNSVNLYEIKWINSKNKTLQIAIEKDDGSMDLETCELISDSISPVLDNLINFAYMLEVCSPGAEREIKDLGKLNEYVGKHIYLRLKHSIDKQIEFTGDIDSVGDKLLLKYKDKTRYKLVEIDFDNIDFIRFAVNI